MLKFLPVLTVAPLLLAWLLAQGSGPAWLGLTAVALVGAAATVPMRRLLAHADKVLAAPGIAHFAQRPAWYDALPDERRSHTSELVSFDGLAGSRVAVIGGRQSAYEWAALLCDHGAERVDVVHRHDTPAFERVSWAFVNPYVEQTLTPGRS